MVEAKKILSYHVLHIVYPHLQHLAYLLVSSFTHHSVFLEDCVFCTIISLTQSRSQIKYLLN